MTGGLGAGPSSSRGAVRRSRRTNPASFPHDQSSARTAHRSPSPWSRGARPSDRVPRRRTQGEDWRRHPDSKRGIGVLQTLALPHSRSSGSCGRELHRGGLVGRWWDLGCGRFRQLGVRLVLAWQQAPRKLRYHGSVEAVAMVRGPIVVAAGGSDRAIRRLALGYGREAIDPARVHR